MDNHKVSASLPGNMLVTLAAAVIIIAGIKISASMMVPFLLATFIAILVSPLMIWLTERRVPTTLAVILVIAVTLATAMILGSLIGSSLNDFYNDLPGYEEKLKSQLHSLDQWLNTLGIDPDMDGLLNYFDPSTAMTMVGRVFAGLGGVLANAFLIIFTVIFILLEASTFSDKAKHAFGNDTQAVAAFSRFSTSVKQYLKIKTLVSMGTGVTAGLLCWLLGVDYAVLWGLVAFLLNYIPNIGSIIAAVPVALIALVQLGPGAMLVVAWGYIIINTVFGSVVEPRLMGRSLGLSTLVVFVSLVFWGWVLGPVGMLLSVPLTMVVKIALEETRHYHWLAVLLGNS